jgi:hypothetical protein
MREINPCPASLMHPHFSALAAVVVACVLSLFGGAAGAALPDHAIAPARSVDPDQVLTGEIGPADLSTCRALPFAVPAGVVRLSAELSYTGRDQYTVLDLGISDPDGSRGWSGSNKASLTLSRTDATPSYLPGAIRPGRWAIDLCISAIRPGRHDRYTVKLWFWRHGDTPAVSTFAAAPLKTGARWYRGDLHLHTAHSDGACTPASGHGQAPCPVYRIVAAAAARGLDFIAISDHNTGAHYNDMRELQPAFDTLLLTPPWRSRRCMVTPTCSEPPRGSIGDCRLRVPLTTFSRTPRPCTPWSR